EKATNGYFVNNFIYAGKGNFIARLENNKLEEGDVRYATLNVYNKTFKWVEGLPAGIKDLGFADKGNYSAMDGKTVYVGITTKEGSYIYKMDAETASATRGVKVEGGTITAITKVASK
ncbi:MAG: DUF4374 domain-containing protein, partial [Flavobacterium sp.]